MTIPNYKQSLQYYLNLITSQYRLGPNQMAWTKALFGPLVDLTNAIAEINEQYDLDTAIGVQLDYCGQIQGISRVVPFQPSGGVSPILDDPTYRLLIKATLAKNTWDGHTSSLYPIWQFLFPGLGISINDNQNMTATIVVSGTYSSIEQDLISNGFIVPRPEGVLYTFVFGHFPVFGADLNNSSIAGADLGNTT